jgi:hypothetical protein
VVSGSLAVDEIPVSYSAVIDPTRLRLQAEAADVPAERAAQVSTVSRAELTTVAHVRNEHSATVELGGNESTC